MSTVEEELLAVERQLWKNDAVLYHDHLLPEALLVFPETGVISRDAAVEAIGGENAEGRHWAEVAFEAVRVTVPAEGTAILTYTSVSRWENEAAPIRALCTSVYIRRQGAWKLAAHQQSPV